MPSRPAVVSSVYFAVGRGGAILPVALIEKAPGNDLPVKLRADLISIGFWVMKEADRVRDDQSRSLKGLIDVSSIIRDGLK